MARLVATIGTSPGTVYETLLNLCRGRYDSGEEKTSPIPVDTVVIAYTSAQKVVNAYRVASLLVKCSKTLFQGTKKELPSPCNVEKIIGVPLGIADVSSRKEYEIFYEKIGSYIDQGDVVDVTGGRVAMAVAAAIRAAKRDAMVVASTVPPEKYRELGSVFDSILQTYDLDRIISEVENSGCEALDKYENLKTALRKLVTGEAQTYVLFPLP